MIPQASDRNELVAGVLSSDPERSRAAATAIGIPADRAYSDADELFASEQARPDGPRDDNGVWHFHRPDGSELTQPAAA